MKGFLLGVFVFGILFITNLIPLAVGERLRGVTAVLLVALGFCMVAYEMYCFDKDGVTFHE